MAASEASSGADREGVRAKANTTRQPYPAAGATTAAAEKRRRDEGSQPKAIHRYHGHVAIIKRLAALRHQTRNTNLRAVQRSVLSGCIAKAKHRPALGDRVITADLAKQTYYGDRDAAAGCVGRQRVARPRKAATSTGAGTHDGRRQF